MIFSRGRKEGIFRQWVELINRKNFGRGEPGLMVTLRPMGVAHSRNGGAVEILVPELEAEEAHEILASAVTF